MDELLVERILRAVELVPPGRVASYGDIADVVGTGPRQVGRAMALWGHDLPWWRITNASGRLPEDLLPEAAQHWRGEGIALAAHGRGCRLPDHRVDLPALAVAWQRATAQLGD